MRRKNRGRRMSRSREGRRRRKKKRGRRRRRKRRNRRRGKIFQIVNYCALGAPRHCRELALLIIFIKQAIGI